MRLMSIDEWVRFLQRMDLIGEDLTIRGARFIFAVSKVRKVPGTMVGGVWYSIVNVTY